MPASSRGHDVGVSAGVRDRGCENENENARESTRGVVWRL